MRRVFMTMSALGMLLGVGLCQETTLKTAKEKSSYALGMELGDQFKKQGVDIDLDVFVQAMKDVISGTKTQLTKEEARKEAVAFQNDMTMKLRDKNKKDGEAFLAQNRTKEGVVTLPSGLQYKILQAGTGSKPSIDDIVLCNYRGTLINGTEFDSSYRRNQPAAFPVKGVIKGWTEALQLMPVGSKWQLFVPADLAYGERGSGSLIEPNSTLIFEVELISIQNK
jgi:FKBP-type peptidyl-prolyl cis-trans isomerase FklB